MDAVTYSSQPLATPRIRPHPLHSISASELSLASNVLRRILAQRNGIHAFRFKNVSLREPAKALLLQYLEAEAAGVAPQERPFVPRLVEIIWTTDNERKLHESIISLDTQDEVGRTRAKQGQHSSMDRSEARSRWQTHVLTRH